MHERLLYCLATEWVTPRLPRMSLSLPGKSGVRFSDRPDMTIAVDRDVRHQTKMKSWTFEPMIQVSFIQHPFCLINLLHLYCLFQRCLQLPVDG